MFKDFLNSNNQSLAYVTKSAKRLKSVSPKIKDVLETHFATLVNVQEDTLADYRNMAINHILPIIGDIPVDQFTVEDAQEWFKNLLGSAKTKKNIQAVLSAAIKTAIEKGLVSFNVVVGLKAAREVLKRKPIFLASIQMDEILANFSKEYVLLLEFLVVSGLRWGEATALQRKDLQVDSERVVVSVYKAWKQMPSGMQIGATKTRASVRDVSLPKNFSKKLVEYAKNLDGNGLVFPNPGTGKVFTNSSFHNLAWKKTLAKCSFFDNPRVHDLRHTHASRLIAAGIPLPVIQKRLGNESITTTVNTYGHLALGADQAAADALEQN